MGWGNKGGGDRDVYYARRVPFYGRVSTLLPLIQAFFVVCGLREKNTLSPSHPHLHALYPRSASTIEFWGTHRKSLKTLLTWLHIRHNDSNSHLPKTVNGPPYWSPKLRQAELFLM